MLSYAAIATPANPCAPPSRSSKSGTLMPMAPSSPPPLPPTPEQDDWKTVSYKKDQRKSYQSSPRRSRNDVPRARRSAASYQLPTPQSAPPSNAMHRVVWKEAVVQKKKIPAVPSPPTTQQESIRVLPPNDEVTINKDSTSVHVADGEEFGAYSTSNDLPLGDMLLTASKPSLDVLTAFHPSVSSAVSPPVYPGVNLPSVPSISAPLFDSVPPALLSPPLLPPLSRSSKVPQTKLVSLGPPGYLVPPHSGSSGLPDRSARRKRNRVVDSDFDPEDTDNTDADVSDGDYWESRSVNRKQKGASGKGKGKAKGARGKRGPASLSTLPKQKSKKGQNPTKKLKLHQKHIEHDGDSDEHSEDNEDVDEDEDEGYELSEARKMEEEARVRKLREEGSVREQWVKAGAAKLVAKGGGGGDRVATRRDLESLIERVGSPSTLSLDQKQTRSKLFLKNLKQSDDLAAENLEDGRVAEWKRSSPQAWKDGKLLRNSIPKDLAKCERISLANWPPCENPLSCATMEDWVNTKTYQENAVILDLLPHSFSVVYTGLPVLRMFYSETGQQIIQERADTILGYAVDNGILLEVYGSDSKEMILRSDKFEFTTVELEIPWEGEKPSEERTCVVETILVRKRGGTGGEGTIIVVLAHPCRGSAGWASVLSLRNQDATLSVSNALQPEILSPNPDIHYNEKMYGGNAAPGGRSKMNGVTVNKKAGEEFERGTPLDPLDRGIRLERIIVTYKNDKSTWSRSSSFVENDLTLPASLRNSDVQIAARAMEIRKQETRELRAVPEEERTVEQRRRLDDADRLNDKRRQSEKKALRKGRYRCKLGDCGKRFKNGKALKAHRYSHTGIYPYNCTQCETSNGFCYLSELRAHQSTHTGKWRHQCQELGCDRGFDRHSALEVHRRMHTGERPYQCSFADCDRSFSQKGHCTRHENEVHKASRSRSTSKPSTSSSSNLSAPPLLLPPLGASAPTACPSYPQYLLGIAQPQSHAAAPLPPPNYASSSSFALPPINRASYTPYNYQSSYSPPLSSSGGASSSSTGNTFQTSGTSNSTTLPPLNMAVFSTTTTNSSSDPSSSSAYRSLSSPTTNPSNYAQTSSSSNPYNHPAYGNASSHTFQHPAYARASTSTSNSIGFAPPPPPPPAASTSTNPYSHPALLPPSGTSMDLSTSTSSSNSSPWAGPPPPPLSMSSGSLAAKRRRSETAGPTLQSLKSSTQSKESELEEKDEMEEEGDANDREEKKEGTSLKRLLEEKESGKQSDDEEEREPGRDEREDDDEEEMAPQAQPASTATTRPTKRARTTSAKSDTSKPSRSRATTSGNRPPAPRKKSPKGRVYVAKGNEPPEKKFVCPHPSCGRAFARQSNLNAHIKTHQGIKEFKCPECNKLFSRKHDCTRHCIAIHNYDRESDSKGPIHEPV
ncbi:C2H2-type zinc finger protein [Sporobolomyces salmoneus]|uniref:C2H2-type zinc finger protein n=1 Tax=Sporobolomyces salmoneus TaxID=183962 RepID=UPI00317F9BD2